MAEQTGDPTQFFRDMLSLQGEAVRTFFGPLLATGAGDGKTTGPQHPPADIGAWVESLKRLREVWHAFQQQIVSEGGQAAPFADPAAWQRQLEQLCGAIPLVDREAQQRFWRDGLALWENVLGQYGIGPGAGAAGDADVALPRKDRRFADSRWREQPAFAIIHQTYLLLAEQIEGAVERMDGLAPDKREQLRFATRVLVEALSPANFPATNPVVIDRTLETQGMNLVKGMEHLLADLGRGQLSHTDPDAFAVGRDVAITPGKVVHETPLYQLIQYSPTTAGVLETPLIIFPPWINRFYILDLNPQKSMVRWAVDQGLTVFIVSWKSADASMADIAWDDYIRAQTGAIDHVRARLKVPAVHAVGYCAAGTTLAATLAILARRGQAEKVRSATFFTAQVDFEKAGELKLFCEDGSLLLADQLSRQGYLDGRYMAATFNLMRAQDLIWNYVVSNYLLGEDHPAFDMLFWNGDTTNLPARWHHDYTRDLYRDNRLIVPDSLSADGTAIDLTRVETPCYIQAAREDHIAPAESVYRMTQHFRGPMKFVLAGSGHIAGVVNPPAAGKYQYWTNPDLPPSFEEFVGGAQEHPGSWWTDWIGWLRSFDDRKVPARGRRKPGGRGDKVIEDAPGRYVKMP